jgi:NAD(P)-dependent dehydrogenase (short-subunit alcohol dehydrogenase family)
MSVQVVPMNEIQEAIDMQGDTFDANTTADEVLAGQQLQGVRILVTGGSGGLGKEAARALAAKGAGVILAARSEDKLAQARIDIVAATGNANVATLALDLASLDSVRAAAAEFLSRYQSLGVLINNAGVMASPLLRTADGFEMQFGVCHLGHFLFTGLIMPALLEAVPARIVNLSSAGHQIADVDFDDPNYLQRDYDKWQAYGQAKSANVLFSVALNQRLAAKGVTSTAVHPGAIAETELARHLGAEDFEALMAMQPEGAVMEFKSLAAGAATSVWAATAAELEGRGGLYLENCQPGELNEGGKLQGGYLDRVVDPERAEVLWQLSEQLVGQSFDF